MTNSRSIGSISKLLAVAVVVAAVLGAGRVAEAGRKRVVVLDFEGPKSEKFHDDLVRLIKKSHTVVPAEKWNGAAGQLGAGTLSDKDVKKVARKLKIDVIVQGKIEKRRDEFIIRLKLRAGKSGELIGDSIDTKAQGPRIDGRAQKDLKDELVGKIDDIASNHDSTGDDEDDGPPARRAARPAKGDDDDDKPARKPARNDKAAKAAKDDDDDPPKKTARKPAQKDNDDDADDDRAARRSKFAGRGDDERGSDKVGKARKPEADDDDELPPKKTARAPDRPARPDKADKADRPDKPDKGDDDDDKLPPRKPAGKASDDAKLAARDPAKKPAARPSSEDDDDKLPPRKPAGKAGAGDDGRRAKAKKVASRDDEAEVEDKAKPIDPRAALSPGERFLDASLGMSFTARRFTFAYSAALRARPNGYSGNPAPGALVDVTAYPLALGHTRRDVVKDLGLELVYDRVLKLSSQAQVQQNGMTTTATYSTLESRFALTAVFRHAFGSSPTAPVVLGTLGYQRQQFNILGTIDLPDVKYSMFVPGAGIRFPVMAKLTLAADAKLLLITSTGAIQDPNWYGAAGVIGFDGMVGADYLITPNLFARAAGRFEVISFSFKGTGSQSNARDGNPMTQDVFGAHDNYFGGFLTVGYLY
ncbi:MAG TPA: hypothetical protein VF516_29445 [Kofleriaceae bacterium]